jgi:surface antigen
LVARVQAERVGTRAVESRPDGDVIVWQRPNKPRGITGEQYRSYPESLTMRQLSVDARDSTNRAERFKVITTMLDAAIDGRQIGRRRTSSVRRLVASRLRTGKTRLGRKKCAHRRHDQHGHVFPAVEYAHGRRQYGPLRWLGTFHA